MRLAVVSSHYPTPERPYKYAFVHARVREYQRQGAWVTVLVPGFEEHRAVFDSVSVWYMPAPRIPEVLAQHDVVMVHMLHPHHRPARDGGQVYAFLLRTGFPALVFVHGSEVQRFVRGQQVWPRPWSVRSWLALMYHDGYQLPRMRRYFRRFLREHPAMRFVAVSQWMLDEVQRNLGIDARAKGVIIPNGIDTRRFAFADRWRRRHKILTIRPLMWGGKYAVDLALETMRHMPASFTLDIMGQGPDAARIRQRIRAYGLQGRVRVLERFVPNRALPQVFAEYGLYLAVTRMDAQGVTMCEAMASGLPVVSFAVCGIPEFVQHGRTGLLVPPEGARQAAQALMVLANDRALYRRVALGARRFIETLDLRHTIARELALAAEMRAARRA